MKNEIEDKNRLIAEFMGEQKVVGCYYMPKNGEWTPVPYSYESETKEHYEPKEMKYNSSWNWLMPVVHKCLEICHEASLNEWEQSFCDRFLTRNIESMYSEVIQFIEWDLKQGD